MSVREDLLDTIRALPLAEQQALLDELTAVLKREMRGDIARLHDEQPPLDKTDVDADRVLGMWRNRFDEAETSGEIADRWRREQWQR